MVLSSPSEFGVASSRLAYHQMHSGGHLAESTLHIDGMHCGACIRRVTQVLASTEGVQVIEVRLGAARFTTSASEQIAPAIAAIAKAGYTAHLEE
jgi:copper chaperone CopZ